ncbi:acetylglutamate kinase [Enterococcus sp. CWB-B31]|uniref:acetylglutamate kinase n=1 Tax=Enterococcus sp. CWB-B31 TaxID=2885159 RepID=UPI001E2E0FC4|nr:acetylglutamate kinase [Enterococcus sp. CWB-B31]MCB5955192.1 acetylglutamate kinase [Enterococcus sp. CWB-B31]
MKALIVIKIGGAAGDTLTPGFFSQIHAWQAEGKKIIIVHGGGHYISEMMDCLNIPVCYKNGLRVTTDEVLKITQMVLIGQVQPMITVRFQQENLSAVGLNASSNKIILGEYLDKQTLGHVGKVIDIQTDLLLDLLEKDYIPIVAPLGITDSGEWLNINADDSACQIASELKAETLFLLTDVAGIKYGNEYIKELRISDIESLIEEQVITGGMIPKIKGTEKAIKEGVGTVHITNDILSKGTVIIGKKVAI